MGCSTSDTMVDENKQENMKIGKDDDSGIPERIPGKKKEHEHEYDPLADMDNEGEEIVEVGKK